jgi:hypothetical protein
MNQPDQILTAIARKHLLIRTLKTRRSDSLDFHDVAVWQLKSALQAAFDAGVQSAPPAATPTPGLPTPFDDYEVHGVKRFDATPGQEEEPRGQVIAGHYEQVDDAEADFWSLFGHIPGQGLDCVGDFSTREHAEEIFARITGCRYPDKGNRTTGR